MTAAQPSAAALEAKPAEPTVTTRAVAALTKPVAIVGRTISIAGKKVATVSVGLASWYGDQFHGRRTANGERFDMNALTAAHPSMPLPSYARVTNVTNGRSVIVRVNDRGPYHGGRLIDVSRRTADVLGFRGAGVGNVKVDYVGPANAGDDRKLIATYQEFGRPSAPAGMQMAAFHPVSEAELMGQAPATMLASVAQPAIPAPSSVTSSAAVASTAMPVGLRGSAGAVTAYASQPSIPAASVLGQPLKLAASRTPAPLLASPAAVAPRLAVGTQLASLPAKVDAPKPTKPDAMKLDVPKIATLAPAKRVVHPADPVLASATPAFGVAPAEDVAATDSPKPKAAVSSRIAASFEGFGSPSAAGPDGGASAFSRLR